MIHGFDDTDKTKVEVYPTSEVYTKDEVYSKSERIIFQVTLDNTVPANDRVGIDRKPADIFMVAGLDPSKYNIDDFSLIAMEYRFSTSEHWLQEQNDMTNSTVYFSWHGDYMFFALKNNTSESKRIIGRFTWMRTKP